MKNTFKTYLITFAILISMVAAAQKPASPPAKAEGKIGSATITIDYSQPSAKGRKIMGGLNPWGEVWRTGANATTSIDFSADVKVEGQALAKGKYGLFTIPGENEWTIIFNSQATGSPFDYSDKKDVLRVKVKSSKTASFVETFVISVEKDQVVLKWENTQVAFGVKG